LILNIKQFFTLTIIKHNQILYISLLYFMINQILLFIVHHHIWINYLKSNNLTIYNLLIKIHLIQDLIILVLNQSFKKEMNSY